MTSALAHPAALSGAPSLRVMQLLVEAVGAHARGDRAAARVGYEALRDIEPRHLQASQMLALIEFDEGRPAAAACLLEACAADAPNDSVVRENLGAAYRMSGRYGPAVASLDRSIALHPSSAMAHAHRAAALHALERYDEARDAYDIALSLAPGHPEILAWRAMLALVDHDGEEALRLLDQALAAKPDLVVAHGNRGFALRAAGRIEEAVAAFDRALQGAPTEPTFLFGKALCLLTSGDYKRGWPLYELRYAATPQAGPGQPQRRHFTEPLYTGEQSISGKVLLLHHDQGLGDMIMMARFATVAAALGARVVLETRSSLTSLLSRIDGVHQVVEVGDELPPVDLQCPLMSAPAVFRTGRHHIPGRDGYLVADGRRAAQWAERLGAKTCVRIGIAWSGNPEHENDRHRSLPLAELLPVLHGLPAEFVSLQPVTRDSDLPAAAANPWLRRLEAELVDFEETAALCSHMDLVLTVDTSIVHLAGALGRPTWLMPPFPPDFRWPLFEEACPWYSSVRTLWPQPATTGWAPLLQHVRSELSAWINVHSPA